MDERIEEIILSQDLESLIKSIAKKFYNVEKKDLYQAGYIGAIKAFNNYKIDSDIKFSTFAYKYIFGEMFELAKDNRNIKLNKNYLKIYKNIKKAKSLLTQKFNREPSLKEISMYLEIDLNLLNDVIITSSEILSLDNESLNESNLYAFIGNNNDFVDSFLIKDSIDKLDINEKKVINYRYYFGYTQEEVAKILGINQVKVSRIESTSKKKLKKYICA